MSANLVEFRTTVNRAGYQWVEAISVDQPAPPEPLPLGASQRAQLRYKSQKRDAKPRWFLTDGIAIGQDRGSFDVRTPLRDNPGLLHRAFADVEPTKVGINSFANGYGQIGSAGDVAELVPIESAREPGANGVPLGIADELQACVREIRNLRVAVQLWDWVQEKNLDALAKHFEPRDNQIVFTWSEQDWSVEATVVSDVVRPRLWSLIGTQDVFFPAKIQVQDIINRHLYERQRVGSRLMLNSSTMGLEHHIMPRSLIGAIWLDFALSVDGNNVYRRCEFCGEAFPAGGRGLPKKYCSNKCRVAGNRRRQKEKAEASQ